MYPIAHVVAASGAAWSAERLAHRLVRSRSTTSGDRAAGDSGLLFDYRLVAAGAWLPDAMDKPLAWFILRGRVEDDHLFGHTLLFGLVLAVPGLCLAWRGQAALISVAGGVIAHRLCDPIWPEIDTLVWPLNGLTFEHSTTPYFGIYMLLEILALAVLFLYTRLIWDRGRMWLLLGAGRI
jgi:hypothetical protein